MRTGRRVWSTFRSFYRFNGKPGRHGLNDRTGRERKDEGGGGYLFVTDLAPSNLGHLGAKLTTSSILSFIGNKKIRVGPEQLPEQTQPNIFKTKESQQSTKNKIWIFVLFVIHKGGVPIPSVPLRTDPYWPLFSSWRFHRACGCGAYSCSSCRCHYHCLYLRQRYCFIACNSCFLVAPSLLDWKAR